MTCNNRHILTMKNEPMLIMRQHHSTGFKGALIYNMKRTHYLKIQTHYLKNILTTLHIKKAVRDTMWITDLLAPVERKVLKIIFENHKATFYLKINCLIF